MKTDLSPSNTDFIPDYGGWENDFDERCRQQNEITVKLKSRDLPAGVEQDIRERAARNGFRLALDQADSGTLVFNKPRELSASADAAQARGISPSPSPPGTGIG